MNDLQPADIEAGAVRLLATLLHGQRNRLSGISLESVDLREQAASLGCDVDTERLDAQVREWGDELRGIRERLEPSDPQRVPLSADALIGRWWEEVPARMAKLWDEINGDADHVAELLPTFAVEELPLEADAKQVMTALDVLLLNALEGSPEAAGEVVGIDARESEHGMAVVISNRVAEVPAEIERWGQILGYTTRRRHLGLGCRYARLVAEAHGGSCGWVYRPESEQVLAAFWLPRAEL